MCKHAIRTHRPYHLSDSEGTHRNMEETPVSHTETWRRKLGSVLQDRSASVPERSGAVRSGAKNPPAPKNCGPALWLMPVLHGHTRRIKIKKAASQGGSELIILNQPAQ